MKHNITLTHGLLIAAAVFLFDQASKWWALEIMKLAERPRMVLPNLNLVLVWNKGISFGMFASDSALGAAVLVAVAAIIVVVLLVWLARANHALVVTAIGLIIGGAIGNIVDRFRFGAVVDFIDVHVAGWHWPAFNVADSAIFIGVALLCIDSVRQSRVKDNNEGHHS